MTDRLDKVLAAYAALPATLRTEEPFDRTRLAWCLDNFDHVTSLLNGNLEFIKYQQETLHKLLARRGDEVVYTRGKRWCTKEVCFLSTKREIREYCNEELYDDVDAEESHWRICLWLAKAVSAPIDHYRKLRALFSKKDGYVMLNGGENYGFEECSAEIRGLYEKLRARYPQFESRAQDESNPVGKYMSAILNTCESVFVYTALRVCQEEGYSVGGIFFDGFYVRKSAQDLGATLMRVGAALHDGYGITYYFRVKEPAHTIAQSVRPRVEYAAPCVRDHDPATGANRYVRVEDLGDDARVTVVHAGLGMGKSRAIEDFTRAAIAARAYTHLFVICPRRTYSRSVLARYRAFLPEILHYGDTRSTQIRKPHVIIQFESLWRIDRSAITPKARVLLVLDECEATCTQISSFATNHSENNPRAHRDNIEMFEHLLRTARKVIALDAFADKSQKFLHVVRDLGLDYRMYKYTFQYVQRPYTRVSTADVLTAALIAALRAGEKVFCFSSSAYRADKIIDAAQGALPGLACAKYVGDFKTTDLSNVNETWACYQLVVCSSTVTIGIDFNLEHFDYLFMYLSQKSRNLIRDAMQASYRPRKVSKGAVVCIDANEHNVQHTQYRVDLDFARTQHGCHMNEYYRILDRSGLRAIKWEKMHWLRNLIIRNSREHIEDVYMLEARALAMLEYCGYHHDPSNDFFLRLTASSARQTMRSGFARTGSTFSSTRSWTDWGTQPPLRTRPWQPWMQRRAR